MAAAAIEHARVLLTCMAEDCADAVADLSNRKGELKREQQSIIKDIRNQQRKRARLLEKADGLGEADILNGLYIGTAAKAKAKAKSNAN